MVLCVFTANSHASQSCERLTQMAPNAPNGRSIPFACALFASWFSKCPCAGAGSYQVAARIWDGRFTHFSVIQQVGTPLWTRSQQFQKYIWWTSIASCTDLSLLGMITRDDHNPSACNSHQPADIFSMSRASKICHEYNPNIIISHACWRLSSGCLRFFIISTHYMSFKSPVNLHFSFHWLSPHEPT